MTGQPAQPSPTPITAAFVLFERLTALDAIGPYEVLQRIPHLQPVFVGHAPGTVRTENAFLGLSVDAAFEEVPHPDLIVMPGGVGTRALLRDERLLGWLRRAHAESTLTTSVCTGSLVIAAAGLLDGLTAATHWSARELLATLGAEPSTDRVVEHLPQRIITAEGVSSGIDMALRLVELLVDETAARAAQLMIEYDPQPPFASGCLERADSATLERARAYGAVRD